MDSGGRLCPRSFLSALVLSLAALASFASMAWAKASDLRAFTDTYGTDGTRLDTCTLCHGSSFSELNPFGLDYLQALGMTGGDEYSAFAMIADMDSDGDGSTNIMEIAMLTFPGDPNDPPAPSPTPPPPSPTPEPTDPPSPTAVPTDPPPTATPTPKPEIPSPTPTTVTSPTPTAVISPTATPTPYGEVIDAVVNLVGRKAWSDPKKYAVPRDIGNPLMLYGRVKNMGASPTMVQVRFVITEKHSGALVDEAMTTPVALAPGATIDLSAQWAKPSLGRYLIYAQAWYDSTGDGIPDVSGRTVKRFKLDVKAKGFVDLARRKAWAEIKHFDPSEGDGVLTFHAIVQSIGQRAADTEVHFQITEKEGGRPLMELVTKVISLGPGELIELWADWSDPPLGEYKVFASVWYDSDGDGSLDARGKHTKQFTVEIELKDHEKEEHKK